MNAAGESTLERRFWRFWLAGILIFAGLVAMNPFIANIHAPSGILDHQVAGTAAKVDAIQRQWQADGMLWLARLGMFGDLLFIGTYGYGAWLGGKLMRTYDRPALSRLGSVIMVAALVFVVADYGETICQFIQVMQVRGSDALASFAATVRMPKSPAFLITFIGLLVALAIRRTARRPA